MLNPIILASGSQYRQALLKYIVADFDAISPDVDETPRVNESPHGLAKRLARMKAEAIASQYPNAIVIGADQVAVCDGQLLGKPGSYEKAFKQLLFCSGKNAEFITQIALVHQHSKLYLTELSQVDLRFLQLTPATIDQYLRRDRPYDCAGSFKVESYGISLFAKIESDDPTSLQGLPLIALNRLLKQAVNGMTNCPPATH